jgi:hypothetical protein
MRIVRGVSQFDDQGAEDLEGLLQGADVKVRTSWRRG